MVRIRSRAYIAVLKGYSGYDLNVIKHFIRSKCEEWQIGYYVDSELKLHSLSIYMRFKDPIALSTIQKLNHQLEIIQTKVSFKDIEDLYKSSTKVESSVNMPKVRTSPAMDTSSRPDWQQGLLKVIEMQTDLGMIIWVNYERSSSPGFENFMAFVRELALREDVILTNKGGVPEIVVPLKEAMFPQLDKKAIVLRPDRNMIDDDYYDMLHQLRTGYIDTSAVNDKPCLVRPLNIIVFTNAFPTEEAKRVMVIEYTTI